MRADEEFWDDVFIAALPALIRQGVDVNGMPETTAYAFARLAALMANEALEERERHHDD